MAFGLVLYYEFISFASGQLFGAGLLCIEMIKTRLARDEFAVLGYLQSLGV